MPEHSPASARPRARRRVAPRSAVAAAQMVTGAPAELKAVLGAMPEAVLVTDHDDRVRVVNPAADRLFAGRPVRDRKDLLSRFEPLPAGSAPEQPVTLRPRDLPNRWFELRSFPIGRTSPEASRVADTAGRILVLRDVTSSREQRAERKAFLAVLSHELRTPITTIYAGSRVLARRGATTPGASIEIAADISAEAARLYDVVEDLLVLTRAEQDILELSSEPVLLQRVVEGAIRVAHGRDPNVPIVRAGASDPPAVRGDIAYVDQVVRDLLTAASRFAGPGSPIIIRLEAAADEVRLSVLDRGPAPTDQELASMFEIADAARTARLAGRGIGPFVCRRLIEAMGGRIWAARRDGGGAETGFALPRFIDSD